MYDVIVVGLGAMGSAAAQHLAERGRRVLGLDQFPALHSFGSSHGNSRMIRQSYWEHPAYVPLLLRAYELWERLERDTAQTQSADAADLLRMTGGLVLGTRAGDLVERSRQAAEEHGLPHEILDAAELRRRFPQFLVKDESYALFEARAGYLRAAHCLRAQLSAAVRRGAELRFEEPVVRWRELPDSAIEVVTPAGTYLAHKVVFTAGPWATQLLDALHLPLTITRQILFWFRPAAELGLFASPRCPVYIVEPESENGELPASPVLYGFPETPDEPGTVKVALHGSAEIVRPKDLDRALPEHRETAGGVDRVVRAEEIAHMRQRLSGVLPSLAKAPLAHAETCLYTMTPDEHFVVDLHPANPNIVLAAGFSGHGFKFANLIGEILADLSIDGGTKQPIELFAATRFSQGDRNSHRNSHTWEPTIGESR